LAQGRSSRSAFLSPWVHPIPPSIGFPSTPLPTQFPFPSCQQGEILSLRERPEGRFGQLGDASFLWEALLWSYGVGIMVASLLRRCGFAAGLLGLLLAKLTPALLLTSPSRAASKRKMAGLLKTSGAASGAISAQTAAEERACAIYSDGFSRVACETDVSPEDVRIHYDDWICKGMPKGSHCRAKTRKMTPEICFDFCREYKEAKFFALQGSTCYCEPWYHGWSVKGGPCDFACEGDPKEKCGSADKASLFEMHFCGGTTGKVQNVLSVAEEQAGALNASVAAATTGEEKLYAISDAWNLGICSASKQNVCDLKGHWAESAGTLRKVAAAATHARTVLESEVGKLKSLDAAITANPKNATGVMYGELEAQIKVVGAEGKKVAKEMNKVDFALRKFEGPLRTSKPLENFDEMFQSLANNELSPSHAVCDMELQKAASVFEAVRDKADVSVCGAKCLDMQDKCVAFNVQFYKGLMSCQFLSREGLVRPALLFAVPIFEVSQSRQDKMSFGVIDCYAKKAFMMNNGRGKTKVETLKQVVVE